MQFSFEYCIDPKDHKSEEDIKAFAVHKNSQDMCSDCPNWMKKMAGGRPSEDLKLLQLCLLQCQHTTYMWKCVIWNKYT